MFAALAIVMMVRAQIEINTTEELQAVALDAYYNQNTYSGVTIKLTADLDLADIPWIPIGTIEVPFNGTFDGGGHTISNLNVQIDGAMTGNVAGFFGVIGSSGIVKDLHIGESHIGDHEGLIFIDESDGSTCYLGLSQASTTERLLAARTRLL